ncbi:hypothetical protein BLW93_08445 [Desulfurobacterium indicum]|uniref:Uncharacterized protein n=2 Tax=Desulfurobacterium indicum TaxID=1914305 RepID=A0A1R1MJ55_9BACT|nr:hypothetical protein BLW93_08445 [Desulfurobacterium indicum]
MSIASSLFIYIQFLKNGSSVSLKTININNQTITINKTYKSKEKQKQFLVTRINISGKINSIIINGKKYVLPKTINFTKNSSQAIFITVNNKKLYVENQQLLNINKKVLFTIPSLKTIGVIDKNTGLIAGFIGTQNTPTGIAVNNNKIFVGYKNTSVISVLSLENGFHISDIPIPGDGTCRIENSKNKLFILSSDKKRLIIYNISAGITNSIIFPRKISDFFVNNATDTILTVDGDTGNIDMFSMTNGNRIGTVIIPGSIISVCGDEKNIYAADDFSKTIVKYSLISRTSDVEELINRPLKIRNFNNLIFTVTYSHLIAFDTFSLNPYATFNIKGISELIFTGDKIFVFSKSGKYFVIDASSFYTETVGDIPEAVLEGTYN